MGKTVGHAGEEPATEPERRVNSGRRRRSVRLLGAAGGSLAAYDHDVDSTNQALLFALLGAVLGAGVVVAWRVSDKQLRSAAIVEGPAVPPGITTVLGVLRSSAVVVDENDLVLKASAPAHAMGLVSGNTLQVEELADVIRQVRRDGQIR